MTNSKLFLYCCLFFVSGIAIQSFFFSAFAVENIFWFYLVIFFGVISILFREKRKILILSLIGLFLFLGMWRYSISLPSAYPNEIQRYNNQEITFQGFISKEPDLRQNNQKLEIAVKTAEVSPGILAEISGKILLTTTLYPIYQYGDFLEAKCYLRTPERFSGFSYDRYLARYDIYSVCYWPEKIQSHPSPLLEKERGQLEVLSLTKGELEGVETYFYKKIYSFKNKLREKIDFGMREPSASLAKAIVMGDKKQIPDDLREKFSQAGLSHIVAISGMHISIIAGILMMILLGAGFGRRPAFLFSSIFLFTYIAMIGFPPSAIRAGIMGFLVLLALNFGRLNKLSNSLFLTAFVLLFINPKLLRDDIGFQLSFLAVLGIALIYPILDNLSEKFLNLIKLSHSFRSLAIIRLSRDIINITISAQVFTLPIIAVNFHQLSLVVVLSNLLVIWILPIFMISVFLALFLSFIFSEFAVIFFLLPEIILKYVMMVTGTLTGLPYSSVKVEYLWWPWILFYYCFIGVLINLFLPRPFIKNK